ncbi:MAG TPA: YihY/virulence factor BrkB family protein [Candidatus Dormibacteraeota bacterium]|nr:YihY/virulence factor BrkB family protein [Candidatus Dormibacteraeota bacterium]
MSTPTQSADAPLRLHGGWRAALARFGHAYLSSGASQYATMVAFSLFVALMPLLLGVLSLWGLVARNVRRFDAVRSMLVHLFPSDLQGAVGQLVSGTGSHVVLIAVASVVSLFWFSTGLFSTIGFALNRIHHLPDRSFVQQRLRGLMLPFPLIGATYLAAGVSLGARQSKIPIWLVPVALWIGLTWLIGFLYRRAPSRRDPVAMIFPGSALASGLIVGLAFVFPLYAAVSESISSGARLLTAVFVLVAWIYCTAQALMVGALVNLLRATRA